MDAERDAVDGSFAVSDAIEREARRLGTNLRRMQGLDEDGSPQPANGITIDVAHDRSVAALDALSQIEPGAYVVFISEQGFDGDDDQLSVLRTADPFDAVRAMGTNGANFDITNAMVIERLTLWRERYGLTVVGAGFDWLWVQFARAAPDWTAFADEVYEFCPDAVDQGVGTVEALAEGLRDTRTVYLWWD